MLDTSNYVADIFSIPLETLMEKHDMSVRAFNVCKDNGLLNLGLILHHWHENKSFSKFRNLGRKTELELLNICELHLSDDVIVEYLLLLSDSTNNRLVVS